MKWREYNHCEIPLLIIPRLFVRYFRFDDEYQEIVEMRRDTNANETKGQMYTFIIELCYYETWRASLPSPYLAFKPNKNSFTEKGRLSFIDI